MKLRNKSRNAASDKYADTVIQTSYTIRIDIII